MGEKHANRVLTCRCKKTISDVKLDNPKLRRMLERQRPKLLPCRQIMMSLLPRCPLVDRLENRSRGMDGGEGALGMGVSTGVSKTEVGRK